MWWRIAVSDSSHDGDKLFTLFERLHEHNKFEGQVLAFDRPAYHQSTCGRVWQKGEWMRCDIYFRCQVKKGKWVIPFQPVIQIRVHIQQNTCFIMLLKSSALIILYLGIRICDKLCSAHISFLQTKEVKPLLGGVRNEVDILSKEEMHRTRDISLTNSWEAGRIHTLSV